MSRQTSLINRPETADMMELGQGVKKVEWVTDSRSPLCGTFIVYLEDHTFGTLIRSRLSKDERVAFVGYRVPHPLENKLEIRLRCKVDSPFTVMLNAISSVRLNVSHLKKVYLSALREKSGTINANSFHVIHRCVTITRGLELCCLQSLHTKTGVDPEAWKVCINPQVEPKIQSSHITALDVCEAPRTLSNYRFVVVVGYASGVICLAGVGSDGVFHIISHNDKNNSQVLHVEVHLDSKADTIGRPALHSFALLEGGTIIRFAWDNLQQTNIECGEGIVGIRASFMHSLIVQYAADRMVLKALDTDTAIKTFEKVGSDKWNQNAICFHPQKPLIAFAGDSAVRYTAAPRWETYEFGRGAVHTEAISCLHFIMLSDMVALMTASSDKIAVWDFDSQTVLYSRPGRQFRVCTLTDVGEKEVTLAIIGDLNSSEPWQVTRLSLPADDRMVEIGVKRPAAASGQTERSGMTNNKRLRRMVDVEAEDAGDNEQEDGFFDGIDAIDVEPEKWETPRSESGDRRHNDDVLNMLNDEASITLMDDLERLKRRVAQLEKRSEKRYPLTPGACPPPADESSQWLMYWDDVGQITKQGSDDSSTLHVHLFSGPNAGYIQRHDRHNCHTAALSPRSLVTGSDVMFAGAPHGLVTFNNLTTNEIWERRLKNDAIAAVAVADDFVAALGNGVLYLFSVAGSVLGVYQLKGEAVGIAAKGNLLAVISDCSSYQRSSSLYSIRLLWVNGLRGLARNSLNRVVDLYDDLLVLPSGRHVAWLSISDQLNLWIADSSGQLLSLVPAMASFHKLGGVSFEWVPSLHLADLLPDATHDEPRKHIKAFPLYVNDQKLCYVRLKDNERYPHSHAPVNFLGYTLRKAPLRIECASGAYMPFSQFHSVMTRDPKLKEVSASGVVEDVAAIPWQQYDEMRHSLTLQGAQLELLMQLQQAYGFWFRDAERVTQKAATSMGNVELVHDKWLLRMLRKVKGQRQDGNVLFDVLRMIRFQRCLDTAADILADQMDSRQRKVLQDASMLLAGVPSRELFASHDQQVQENQPSARSSEVDRTSGLSVNEVSVVRAPADTVKDLAAAMSNVVPQPQTTTASKAAGRPVPGFVPVQNDNKEPDNWMEQVFKS
ncbi:DNA-directed RNA polymerase II subunit RPB11 [Babesia sp. Xinjiang]|uniref:DNA-directed RNA polymerase II subunit RPB11 n=1 Tax=Babesia sp. Xinjiang TaxID=462227 RepID=UPI000A2167D8|nr:DNA-directed RNA polymerase II subunit RPB11 [Babesia sp. Xinjiang]ORM42374.1 DNA-directed RNA polymerase II subunit RPB11 [Babesia sp. Xinjiang]